MRKIRFRGIDLRVLDEQAEAAIRASGESTIFHCCLRAVDCSSLPPALAARVQARECPGCGHRMLYDIRSLPKTLLTISMCIQCVEAHFRGRPTLGFAPAGLLR